MRLRLDPRDAHAATVTSKEKQEKKMKKYVNSSLKILLPCLIFFGVLLFAAVLMLFLELVSSSIAVQWTIFAFPLFILFLTIFFAGKSRYLTVDDRQITLPRGAIINGKTVSSRTVVDFSSIRSFDSVLRKGDHGVFALLVSLIVFQGASVGDAEFYSIKLSNGDKVTFTLYEFGKNSEKEIVSTIKRRMAHKKD